MTPLGWLGRKTSRQTNTYSLDTSRTNCMFKLLWPRIVHTKTNQYVFLICNVKPQDIVTTRSNELLARLGIEDLDLILKERKLRWYGHVERTNVQSRQPLIYRLMESVGQGGQRCNGSNWQRGIAESRSSRLSTLMIDIPGDLVWDLPYMQQARYLEGGPLMWMLPL